MPSRGRTVVWCFVALIAVRVLVVGVTLHDLATTAPRAALTGDVRRYHRIASERGTPYADFAVEYPPVTLAAIDALDGSTVRQAVPRVMWSQLILDILIAAIVAWGWGRRAALLYLLLGLAFVWYPFLYLRLDLVSVALAVGGLALVRRGRVVGGGALLAVACFAKIWPLALAPVLVVRRSARSFAAFAAVAATSLAAWVGWAGFAGPIQVLTFRGARGWQIESVVGNLLHTFSYHRARMERGALRVGVVPGWARVGLPLLGLLLVAAVWTLVARVRESDPRVSDGLAPIAAIAALLVFATILSPQYISWLLPFAAIAAAGGERAVAWLTGVAAFLSTVGIKLMTALGTGGLLPLGVVFARNVVLVVLLATAIWRLIRLSREAQEGASIGTPVVLQVGSLARPVPVAERPVPVGGDHVIAAVSARRPARDVDEATDSARLGFGSGRG
jgi:hypothetical protein